MEGGKQTDVTVKFMTDSAKVAQKNINALVKEFHNLERAADRAEKSFIKAVHASERRSLNKMVSGARGGEAEWNRNQKREAAAIEAMKKGARMGLESAQSVSQWGRAFGDFSTMAGGGLFRIRSFINLIQRIPSPVKVAAVGVLGIGYAINNMVKEGAIAEGSIINMTALIGRQTDAIRIYRDALRFAGATAFDPAELGAAAGRAVQYGIADPFKKNLQGVKGMVSSMDIFASLGSFTDMEGRMIGVGRAMQAIMTGNLKMAMAFRGVIGDAWEKTKKVAKVGTKEWGTEILKNIALIPKVMDLATMRGESVVGLWSTIVGYGKELSVIMSGVSSTNQFTFWKQLQAILLSIRDVGRTFIDENEVFFERLGSWIGGIFTLIAEVFRVVWYVLQPLLDFVWTWFKGTLMVVIEGIVVVIRLLWQLILGILSTVSELLQRIPFISNILKNFADYMSSLKTWFDNSITWFQAMYVAISAAFRSLFSEESIKKFVDAIEGAFMGMVWAISKALDIIWLRAQQVWALVNGGTSSSKMKDIQKKIEKVGTGSDAFEPAWNQELRNREINKRAENAVSNYTTNNRNAAVVNNSIIYQIVDHKMDTVTIVDHTTNSTANPKQTVTIIIK